MARLKVTSWNIEHMRKLFVTEGSQTKLKRIKRRREQIAKEMLDLDADVFCLLETTNKTDDVKTFCADDLGGAYVLVEDGPDEPRQRGTQWIRFLVKPGLAGEASMLPRAAYTDFAGDKWTVNYWGDFEEESHRHYRHPQVLVLNWLGQRIEMIGLHLKSKFVRMGQSDWNAGGARQQKFIQAAIKARIKLTTEAANVRAYIDAKFEQTASPNILVMGDLNDGPGKELFERQYLFFDLISNIQGDVFFANRFLNHALFDFPEHLRWTVDFNDFVDPARNPHILLDHILFTQSLVDGSQPFKINSGGGLVEHEVHELTNAGQPQYAHTSDHRPVSVVMEGV